MSIFRIWKSHNVSLLKRMLYLQKKHNTVFSLSRSRCSLTENFVICPYFGYENRLIKKGKNNFIQKASIKRFHNEPFLKLENRGFLSISFTDPGNFFKTFPVIKYRDAWRINLKITNEAKSICINYCRCLKL